ncbi:MAG: amino acid permease [Candidatus Saganbacteria bacterium]|nr:amino acid permease [Candidatus Saganbacteria bacterium]
MSNKQGLKKEIGLLTLVALGVGSMIGSGIFAMPAAMGAVAGPGLILAILIAGVVTTLLAISYAELGAAFPITGGPYAFPRLAMGDFAGFLMGWGYFLYLFIGTAAIIDIFVVYLGFYVPGLSVGQTLTPAGVTIAVIALWIFTIINILGVKWGGLYSIITTIGKLIPLILFALIGLMFMKTGNFSPFLPFGLTGVTLAVTLFFWSFTGFESIVIPSEEVKKPSRTIPLAMLLTMAITTAVYVLIAVVFVGMINWKGLNIPFGNWQAIGGLASPLADVSLAWGLPWLAAIATLGAIIATAGSGGDWVLLQGRMPFAMAQDKLFWAPLGKINQKYGTPVASLIFTSILTTIILIAIPNFPSVALIASITAIIPYAAATLSVTILRKTRADVPRPFRLPFPFFITGLGFVFSTLLIYWASWPWTLVGALLIFLGYPAFLLIKEKKFEPGRSTWICVYILGIVFVSFIGDPHFVMNNFLKINPLGILRMPYDIIVLSLFSIAIYTWAYKANTKEEQKWQNHS